VANSTIGIVQRVRAKRALDRLSPAGRSVGEGETRGHTRTLSPEQLVVDDVVVVQPGDQLIADETVPLGDRSSPR
jgi:cation-transporting ATPase E